jgi:hypothetical protein
MIISVNTYRINFLVELITQQPKIYSAVFSVRESFLREFPQIINIPIAETEVICTAFSLKKMKLHEGMVI